MTSLRKRAESETTKGAARVCARLSMGITNYQSVARQKAIQKKVHRNGYVFQHDGHKLFVDKQFVANGHQHAARLAVQQGQLGETKVASDQ